MHHVAVAGLHDLHQLAKLRTDRGDLFLRGLQLPDQPEHIVAARGGAVRKRSHDLRLHPVGKAIDALADLARALGGLGSERAHLGCDQTESEPRRALPMRFDRGVDGKKERLVGNLRDDVERAAQVVKLLRERLQAGVVGADRLITLGQHGTEPRDDRARHGHGVAHCLHA